MITGRYRGFTLVEMMITLLVLSVLVFVAAPAFTDFIKNNRMLSQVYAMRAALNTARTRALSERTFVTVCRSNDGASCTGNWNEGFIAFTDDNFDGVVDDPNDTIFLTNSKPNPGLDISFSDASDLVRFNSRGNATVSGTFTICDDRGNRSARGLIVAPVGAVRAAVLDPNEPGSDSLADCP